MAAATANSTAVQNNSAGAMLTNSAGELVDTSDIMTWGKVMRAMRDVEGYSDAEAKDALVSWYENVLTSTGTDDFGAGVNSGDEMGWSFLFVCAYYDRPLTIVQLLLLGADPHLRITPTGRSPLEMANAEHRDGAILVFKAYNDRAQLEEWNKTGKIPRPKHWSEIPKRDKEENPNKSKPSKRALAMAKQMAEAEDFPTQCSKLFDKYDNDGSGHIDSTELQSIFRELKIKMSDEDVQAMLTQYDADNSGELDKTEFMKMADEAQLGDKMFIETLKEAFVKNDADKSGGIDVCELETAFKELGMDVLREEIEALVDQYDVDGSGELDEEEFIALARDAKEGRMATADDDQLEGGSWSKKEEELFVRGMKMHGENWRKVAALVKTRTAVQTRAHFKNKEKDRKHKEGKEDTENDEHEKRMEALKRAQMTKRAKDKEAKAEMEALAAERRQQDETRRVGKRREAIHEAIAEAQRRTFDGRVFDAETIESWISTKEDELGGMSPGLRHALRAHNVKMGLKRPASPRTRERLRREFEKDVKMYYSEKKLQKLQRMIYECVTSEEFQNQTVWRLRPAEDVEAQCPVGFITQAELADALPAYGHGKNYEKFVFPGLKLKKPYKPKIDPWGQQWDMEAVKRKKQQDEEEYEQRKKEHGMDIF